MLFPILFTVTVVPANKLYPSGDQVKFRYDPAMVESGGAMALDLRWDIRPPSGQSGSRFYLKQFA